MSKIVRIKDKDGNILYPISANPNDFTDYTISTTWEENTDIGDYETYPYKQTISTTVYTTDRDCYVLGGTPSSMPTKEECDEFGKLCQFVDFSNGVTVLASEETTVALTLRVRGV